jgi:hypothetical protein
VTNDILKGGNFSHAAIKRILEHRVSDGGLSKNLSKRELEELVVTVRQELGLEPAGTRYGIG